MPYINVSTGSVSPAAPSSSICISTTGSEVTFTGDDTPTKPSSLPQSQPQPQALVYCFPLPLTSSSTYLPPHSPHFLPSTSHLLSCSPPPAPTWPTKFMSRWSRLLALLKSTPLAPCFTSLPPPVEGQTNPNSSSTPPPQETVYCAFANHPSWVAVESIVLSVSNHALHRSRLESACESARTWRGKLEGLAMLRDWDARTKERDKADWFEENWMPAAERYVGDGGEQPVEEFARRKEYRLKVQSVFREALAEVETLRAEEEERRSECKEKEKLRQHDFFESRMGLVKFWSVSIDPRGQGGEDRLDWEEDAKEDGLGRNDKDSDDGKYISTSAPPLPPAPVPDPRVKLSTADLRRGDSALFLTSPTGAYVAFTTDPGNVSYTLDEAQAEGVKGRPWVIGKVSEVVGDGKRRVVKCDVLFTK
mmetsp:Transcript_7422/g.15408  ORF Transcript_7422/g.15408 Transcript_7422/m.15408 type:complete len:420 (-) Transcript_7422:44-1303(-)|eukprot:CAMPEP_0197559196 /NCGR_PEP_ID=MMETSP1320-20131121/20724_1 /TAXON_ID=91990 /ORGANISM="Bolidomonas sp., Strain RCC2347" /LENGTH=419 /DNA_ID=CAMNT_0043120597 /DNA_START=218 /DNA_END=1477 /DNA_ORIENTATION=+